MSGERDKHDLECVCGNFLEIFIHKDEVRCFINGEEAPSEELREKKFKKVSVKETMSKL